jgi:hypothetical protein
LMMAKVLMALGGAGDRTDRLVELMA